MIYARAIQTTLLRTLLVLLSVAYSYAYALAQEETVQDSLSIAMEEELRSRIDAAQSETQRVRLNEIHDYYSGVEFKAIWVKDDAPSAKAKAVLEALRRARDDGLRSEDYDTEALAEKLSASTLSALADLEIHMSTSLVSFAQHLKAGRVDPLAVTKRNVVYPKKLSPIKILTDGATTQNIKAYLRLLAPHTPRYERLRTALKEYRRMASSGGWPQIAGGQVLKPGMEDERVPALRGRLKISGDYQNGVLVENPNLYDGAIVEAVKRFQERHGLEIDGVIGPNTLTEINITVEQRIVTMEHNLERRRWMQDDYGQYYIFANLADQVVKVVRNEKTIYAEIIQVGLPYHQTPVFSDEMEYIEINPYWNVPYSIATREMLPKLRRNANAFSSQNFEVIRGGQVINASAVPWRSYSRANFPVRLRQKPGPKNALGRVKFMFPNKHNVYIHDTPSKQKFNRASRFFSHGCLRLKDPFRLAEVLLGNQGWTKGRIDATVKKGKRRVVRLEEKIPVHIAYLTSWVNKDGSIHFRRDVYERDTILAKALKRSRS
ncbi:MAG: L,D-transpeptidase family protein [Pseudomonadota bacterium]